MGSGVQGLRVWVEEVNTSCSVELKIQKLVCRTVFFGRIGLLTLSSCSQSLRLSGLATRSPLWVFTRQGL